MSSNESLGRTPESFGVSLEQGVVDIRMIHSLIVSFLPRSVLGGACGALLGLLLALALPKKYQSEAFIEITDNPVEQVVGSATRLEKSEGRDAKFEQTVRVKTIEVIARTENVIGTVNSKLNEKGKHESVVYSAKGIPNTMLVKLTAESKDPLSSISAVNLWADLVIQTVSHQRLEMFQKGESLLSGPFSKLAEEADNLNVRMCMLSPQVSLKKSEATSLESLLVKRVEELKLIDSTIEEMEFTLPILKEELKKHERIFPGNPGRGLEGMEAAFRSLPDFGKDGPRVYGVVNYISNPIYSDLEKKISNNEVELSILVNRKKQLGKLIGKDKGDLERVLQEVGEGTRTLDRLDRQLLLAKKSLDLIFGNLSGTRLAGEVPIANMRIVSYASNSDQVSRKYNVVSLFFAGGALLTFSWLFLKLPSGPKDCLLPGNSSTHMGKVP